MPRSYASQLEGLLVAGRSRAKVGSPRGCVASATCVADATRVVGRVFARHGVAAISAGRALLSVEGTTTAGSSARGRTGSRSGRGGGCGRIARTAHAARRAIGDVAGLAGAAIGIHRTAAASRNAGPTAIANERRRPVRVGDAGIAIAAVRARGARTARIDAGRIGASRNADVVEVTGVLVLAVAAAAIARCIA